MARLPTYFIDDIAVTTRSAEVPDASFNTGLNNGGSNACGIGIGTENPNLEESLPNWTLLDQRGTARTTQISQHIGGSGLGDGTSGIAPEAIIRLGTPSNNGNGFVTYSFNPSLVTLPAGWVAATPPTNVLTTDSGDPLTTDNGDYITAG